MPGLRLCLVSSSGDVNSSMTKIKGDVVDPSMRLMLSAGEEEVPEGVVGLLTPDAPDVLSHVSVRARNMHVLFATCHDEEPLNLIKQAQGQ